jgi:hypothetical protein
MYLLAPKLRLSGSTKVEQYVVAVVVSRKQVWAVALPSGLPRVATNTEVVP